MKAKEADFAPVDELELIDAVRLPSDLERPPVELVHRDVPPRILVKPTPRTFEELYEGQFGELVRLAAMISGSTAVAEDVVQDAFARLYVRFDTVDHPAAYLRRSVLNGCVSRFRKHRRERLVDQHDDGPNEDTAPDERVDLDRRLAQLPDRQRAVVVLRIHQGLPELEVAEILGCRPGTVSSLLHRGLASLRIDLDGGQP
jgi:RNA polymerase sigma-70 factor (sigma-E family)